MSAGRRLYDHLIQVQIGDVIKQSCGCNQFATPTPAIGWSTRVVDTLMMLPDFCLNICCTASCDTERKPASVVETRALKSSVVYSVKGFGIKTPALFISTSIRPNRDTAVSTIVAAVLG